MHKKKGHARPIVPKHAMAPIAAKAANSSAQQQQQHGQAGSMKRKPLVQNGLVQQDKRNTVLGKRKEDEGNAASKQHATANGLAGGDGIQQHKKRKLHVQQQQQEQRNGQYNQHKQERAQRQKSNQQLSHLKQHANGKAAAAPSKQIPQQQQQKAQTQQRKHKKPEQESTQQAAAAQPSKQPQQQPNKKRKHKHQAAATAANPAATANDTAAADANAHGALNAAETATPAVGTVVAKPWHPKQPTAVGSNWQALQQQLKQQAAANPRRPRKPRDAAAGSNDKAAAKGDSSSSNQKQIGAIGHNKAVTPILAMDCEMVGVGPGGERDSLARVSIVNASGNTLYDSYVAQKESVTDYRTWVSGITPANLVGAPDISQVAKEVTDLLQGRVLVGHGLKKDLSVLRLSHPRKNIRDTAKYPPFMFSKGGKRRPRALKILAQEELGLSIQEGQHSSVDDARAALYLYQKHAAVWEKALKTPQGIKQLPTANRPVKKKRVESYGLRDVKDDPLADL